MTSLTERAKAATQEPPRLPAPPPGGGAGSQGHHPQAGFHEIDAGDGNFEMVPVHIAWLRVRRDVRSIAKNEQYNAAGTRYNFRGVDTVVQAFGPVTLKHGVSVLPTQVVAEYRDTTSSKGNKMRECTVSVTWQIFGPAGDSIQLQSAGEALDSADKGTAKAQSVALRVLLLTSGLVPTGDPDPDSSHIDRGEAPLRPLASYLEEVLNPATSAGRLLQVHAELKASNRLAALVTNDQGAEEGIGALIVRIGQERRAAEAAQS